MLELRAPHQLHQNRSVSAVEDTLVCLRGDEASGGMVDEVFGGGTFTDVGSTGAAGSLVGVNQGSTGSRDFDGTMAQRRSATTAQEDAMKLAPVTIAARIRPDVVTGTQTIGGLGYFDLGLSSSNPLLLLRLNGSELEWMWESGGSVVHSGATSGLGLQAGVTYHVAVVRRDPASGTANRCDVELWVDGKLEATFADETMPDAGSASEWCVGGQNNGGVVKGFDGRIQDFIVETYDWSPEKVLDAYARAVQSWDDETVVFNDHNSPSWRVLVQDENGDFVDLNALYGNDFVLGFDTADDVDKKGETCTVRLAREIYAMSLAPDMAGSRPNVDGGGVLIDLARELKIQYAVLPHGSTYDSAAKHWRPLFEGRIIGLNPAGPEMVVECRDRIDELDVTQIEPDRAAAPVLTDFQYGSPTGTAMEGEFQDIIDDQEPSSGWMTTGGHDVYTPAASGFDVKEFYTAPGQSVANRLEQLALQTIGFNLRYKYDDHRKAFRFTFYDPERSRTWSSGDPELYAGDVRQWRKLEYRAEDLVTACEVEYGTAADTDNVGQERRNSVVRTNATGVSRYGRRLGRIGLASNRGTNNQTDAEAIGDAVVSDLGLPRAHGDADIAFAPHIEIGDLVRCYADDQHFDSDTDFAVVGRRHSVSGNRCTTTLTLREGPPVGHIALWAEGILQLPGMREGDGYGPPSTPSGLSATAEVRSVDLEWDFPVDHLNRQYVETEVHASTSSGFITSDSTLQAIHRGNRAQVPADPDDNLYWKVIHRDAMGNYSNASSQVQARARWTPLGMPNAKADRSSSGAQSMSGNTQLLFPDEQWDYSSNFSSSTWTTPSDGAGVYRVTVVFVQDKAGGAKDILCWLEDGASGVISEVLQEGRANNQYTSITFVFTLVLAATDVVEVFANDSLDEDLQPESSVHIELIAQA